MAVRKPFPYYNNFRDYVRQELVRRRARPAVAGIGNQSLDNFTPAITPFVRFTSTLQDVNFKYKFFSLGLHNHVDVSGGPSIFDLTYGDQDVVGYAYSTDSQAAAPARSTRNTKVPVTSLQSKETEQSSVAPALGRHPMPGVTSLAVNHLGPNNYIEVSVTWKCYNSTQLEFLRPHFVTAGSYVVVEMGHQYSDRFPVPVFDFGASDALSKLTACVVQGRAFINDTIVAAARGNYDLYVGRIIGAEISQHADGTFEVVTKLASKGEALLGFDNTRLQGRADDAEARVHTVMDYFSPAAPVGFDLLLSAELQRQTKPNVVDASQGGQQFQQASATARDALAHGAELDPKLQLADTVYVSWDFLLTGVLPDLFSHFTGSNHNSEVAMFTTINQTADSGSAEEPWVGNHPALLSVDLETMVIVKQGAKDKDTTKLFENAPVFEDGELQHKFRGQLSKGVYLNAETIRQAFLQHTKFIEAFQEILTKMNIASADYWRLDIRWDEEKNRIVIYDRGFVADDVSDPGTVYRFNQGVRGELLGFSFNAQYSKEVMAAIMLSAHQTTDTGTNQSSLQGVLQGPDVHGEVLNALTSTTSGGKYLALLDDAVNTRSGAVEARTDNDLQAFLRHGDVKRLQNATLVAQQQQEAAAATAVLKKFDQALKFYVSIPSIIKELIRTDGLQTPGPNNYIAPVPTEISMDLKLQGIGGITFHDAFKVDKLPAIYAKRGVFLVTRLQQSVEREEGWRTSIGGTFYFAFPAQTTEPRPQEVDPLQQPTASQRAGQTVVPADASPTRPSVTAPNHPGPQGTSLGDLQLQGS